VRLNFWSFLLIVLVAAALVFVAAPWFAFRSLRDAAKTNDVPALSQLVDYNAVSDSLDPQLTGAPAPETPPPDIWRHPIQAIEHAFAPHPDAAPPPLVQKYMSSTGLAALADGKAPGQPLPPKGHEPFPMVAFWGPDRCRITVADGADRTRKTEFTFQRNGVFNWKLTRIVLPGHAPPASAAAAPAAK
jgi:hypothetical protein